MCVNSASTVLRGGRSTIYRKVKRLSSTRLVNKKRYNHSNNLSEIGEENELYRGFKCKVQTY